MKVLVTGGAGFIGSHIVDRFIEENNEVSIIDNLSHGKKEYINSKSNFFEMDIRNIEVQNIIQKINPDIVIHNAAQISVSNSCSNPIEDEQINIMGSINILESCRKSNVKRIIYPASAAIFGEPEYFPIDEKHPLNMISNYGVSKHTVEHYIEVYNHLYGLDYTILRYANVYGPRQDSTGEGGVIAIFCEQLLNGIVPDIYGSGEQTRDFVYIEDVVRANALSSKSNRNGIYNVCTNTKISVNKVFETIKSKVNSDILPNYKDARDGDIMHSYMTFEKIKKELKWCPSVSFEEGIEKTIDYYRSCNA